MRDAVHGEGIEPDLFFHDRKPLGPPQAALCQSDLNAGLASELVAFPLTLASSISSANWRRRATFGRQRISIGWRQFETHREAGAARHEQNRRRCRRTPISSFR